jgi:hypothetical protein
VVGGECSWCDWPGHCTRPSCGQILLYQNLRNIANVLVIIIITIEQDNHTDNWFRDTCVRGRSMCTVATDAWLNLNHILNRETSNRKYCWLMSRICALCVYYPLLSCIKTVTFQSNPIYFTQKLNYNMLILESALFVVNYCSSGLLYLMIFMMASELGLYLKINTLGLRYSYFHSWFLIRAIIILKLLIT